MNVAPAEAPSARKPLRLWPGVAAVALQWFFSYLLPVVAPDAASYAVFGALGCGLLALLWWLSLSRAPWLERLGVIAFMAAALFVTYRLVHPSIATGAMGFLLPVMAFPALTLALVLWAAATRGMSAKPRVAALVVFVLLACGVWTLVRTGGFSGGFKNDVHWRWSPTPEDRLLATARDLPAPAPAAAPTPTPAQPAQPEAAPTSAPAAPATLTPAPTGPEWRGFRGASRDGIVPGVRIETDWAKSPPVQLWRRPIGPGWSSFAVRGGHLFTQEQRGPDELVTCYKVATGEPVWVHRDKARFWESNAGPGPRSTPTLGNGRVYTLGATGILNVLNESNGSLIWSRDAAADADTKPPEWGFSSSPLLLNDLVVVALSGQLAAYYLATGTPRWYGPRDRKASYSSPQLYTSNGVTQLLLMSGTGIAAVSPVDGKLLWEHAWAGYPIVQPGLTSEGDLLMSVSDSSGIRRIAVAQSSGSWRVEERWTSIGLKPYFNDFVVHKGHAFGFDGSILACIDLSDGKRRWKGGRFGHGQLVLLPQQDLLVILSEEGELALVKAVPEGFTEVGRVPAISGKTWNHPVLVGDVLLARNGEEMAAFRLSLALP